MWSGNSQEPCHFLLDYCNSLLDAALTALPALTGPPDTQSWCTPV